MNPQFWSGKRVLITGHTGFKGGWLSLLLCRLGARVHGYSLPPPTEPSLYGAARIADVVTEQIGDVRDYAKLSAFIRRYEPEVAFHLAAQPLVGRSYEDPLDTYSTNVMGTANLLQAVRGVPGLRCVINITSDKCYENREWFWPYREDERLGGKDPYSNSKACAELVTQAFRRSFLQDANVHVATARAGNVIGGGDWAPYRLVPDILRSLDAGVPVDIRHPASTRPWQHVLDPLSGYTVLAQKLWEEGGRFAEGWNFGPVSGDSRSVADVVDLFISAWGSGSWRRNGDSERFSESTYLAVDPTKAKALLGWRQRLSVNESVAWTVEWHRAWRAGLDMRAFSGSQISHFLDGTLQ